MPLRRAIGQCRPDSRLTGRRRLAGHENFTVGAIADRLMPRPPSVTEHRLGGRGRMFESCRAHGLFKPFLRARNAEKCTIRPSYSASAPSGESAEPRSAGARVEGVLGLADRGPGGLGAAEDGLLQDR